MRTYPAMSSGGRRLVGAFAVCVLAAASVGVANSTPARATHPSNQTLDYGAIYTESYDGASYRFDVTPVGGGTPIYGEQWDPPTEPNPEWQSSDPGPNGRIAASEETTTTAAWPFLQSIRIVTPPDVGFPGNEWSFDPRAVPVPPAMVPAGYDPSDVYYRGTPQWAGPDTIALEALAWRPGDAYDPQHEGIALIDVSDPGNVTLTSIRWGIPHSYYTWTISPDGSHYTRYSGGHSAQIYDFITNQVTGSVNSILYPEVRWSPSGELIAINNPGGVQFFDVNGVLQHTIQTDEIFVFAWTPDGNGIIALCGDAYNHSVPQDLDLVHYGLDGTRTELTPDFWHVDHPNNIGPPQQFEWMERRGLLTETVTSPGGADIVLDLDGGGEIKSATAVTPPAPPPAGVTFPHGLVGFTLEGVPEGGTAEVTIDFPEALPEPFAYYKYQNGTYVDATSIATHDNGRVTLTLEDNGLFDTDATPGKIVDPGGPVTLAPVATDSFDVSLTGAHTLTAAGALDTGDFTITRDGYGIRSVTGSGTVGSTTVTTNVKRFLNLSFWLGTVTVADTALGTVTTPFFGRVDPAGDDGARATMRWLDFRRFPFRAYNLTWEVHDSD